MNSTAIYNIEVWHNQSARWVATSDRALGYGAARDAMRSWVALGSSARMVDASA